MGGMHLLIEVEVSFLECGKSRTRTDKKVWHVFCALRLNPMLTIRLSCLNPADNQNEPIFCMIQIFCSRRTPVCAVNVFHTNWSTDRSACSFCDWNTRCVSHAPSLSCDRKHGPGGGWSPGTWWCGRLDVAGVRGIREEEDWRAEAEFIGCRTGGTLLRGIERIFYEQTARFPELTWIWSGYWTEERLGSELQPSPQDYLPRIRNGPRRLQGFRVMVQMRFAGLEGLSTEA